MFSSCQRTSGLLVTFWVMEYPKCDKQLWCIWSWKFDFKGWSLWSGMQLMMLPWYTQSATIGRSTINIAAGLQIYWNSFFIQPSCLGFDMKGNCLPKANNLCLFWLSEPHHLTHCSVLQLLVESKAWFHHAKKQQRSNKYNAWYECDTGVFGCNLLHGWPC